MCYEFLLSKVENNVNYFTKIVQNYKHLLITLTIHSVFILFIFKISHHVNLICIFEISSLTFFITNKLPGSDVLYKHQR